MALVACTAAGAICAGNAPDERQRELAPIAASFEKASPCPFYPGTGPLAARLVCGYLEVPERHERADGPHIALPVVVIRSASASPRPDPVVFLHGGPGAAPLESSATIERFASHPFSRERDIILYNQRGSLQTRPALACDTFEANRTSWFTADLTLEQRDVRIAAAVLECLRQLRMQGRDVGAYGARENAADLLALRQALGITQWNVLAVSYGTWMAQLAAAADPRGVRSLILDSIMSPTSDLFMSEGPRNFSLGLDRLLAACGADRECADAFPALGERLHQLLVSLEQHPATVRVASSPAGTALEVVVNWHDFLGVIHWMLYNARTLRLVPLLIAATSRGDFGLLTHLMESVYPGFLHGAPGPGAAFFAIVCNDQFTSRNPLPTAAANKAYGGFAIVSFMARVCEAYASDRALAPAPVTMRIEAPALLLSGRFDPMTPDVYAAELVAGMPQGRRVTIADAGHSTLSDFDACQTLAAVRFLEQPDAKRIDGCIAAIPGPKFVTAWHADPPR